MRFCDKKTAQNRTAPIYIYLFYIKYINNLIIYEVSGQPSISAFQFHVKTTSFWLKYKIKSSKHHSLLHLTLTLTKSKVQKFNIIIFVFYTLNICGTFSLLSICHGFFFFSSLVFICVTFFLHMLYFSKKKK